MSLARCRISKDVVENGETQTNVLIPISIICNFYSIIENLEFQEQISMLRAVAGNMGYSEVRNIPSQQETGKTPSL